MRTRRDIMVNSYFRSEKTRLDLILEVLLDIRDLLNKNKKIK